MLKTVAVITGTVTNGTVTQVQGNGCLLYTSDAADE